AAAGVTIDTRGGHPIADGKLHRVDSADKGGHGKRHAWYTIHLDEPPSGAFGNWRLGIKSTWTADRQVKPLSQAERAAMAKRIEADRRKRDAEAALLAARAADVAARLLSPDNSAAATADHPYLARKRLPAFGGARVLQRDFTYKIDDEDDWRTACKGLLLVPMYATTPGKAKLVGAQLIDGEGVKRFMKGTPKLGAFCSIGRPSSADSPVLIAEGYATAARLHQATGHCAVAACDAGNLAPVAIALKEKRPSARFVICADNDRFTTQPVNNPGLHFARMAADAIGAPLVIPQFGPGGATDFDDLAQLRGLDAVRTALGDVLDGRLA
ncbi:hypothetical protein T281_16730, partial [Rhodomicrobium udaipurense JA643]|uniref:toprim domain-containing protein n=1 Tax=Rhodomicrobium udaipurense TaxID=1202716 RepID=UPI00045A2E08